MLTRGALANERILLTNECIIKAMLCTLVAHKSTGVALSYGDIDTLLLALQAPVELLALADAAVATLSKQTAATAAAHAEAAPAAELVPPGSLLLSCHTRLVLVSQLPLGQLVKHLQDCYSCNAGAPLAGLPQPGVPGLSRCSSIAVPPLRARASDIVPLALQAAATAAVLRGYADVQLTETAALQLSSYDFPGNEIELQGVMQRAVMLHPVAPACSSMTSCSSCGDENNYATAGTQRCNGSTGSCGSLSCDSALAGVAGSVLVLDACDFWQASNDAERHRLDVLELIPWFRPLLDSGLWPHGLNSMTRWLFPLVVASLFLGPQVSAGCCAVPLLALHVGLACSSGSATETRCSLWTGHNALCCQYRAPQCWANHPSPVFPWALCSLQDREHSAALTVFWAGWWPLCLMSFAVVGRAWCAIW